MVISKFRLAMWNTLEEGYMPTRKMIGGRLSFMQRPSLFLTSEGNVDYVGSWFDHEDISFKILFRKACFELNNPRGGSLPSCTYPSYGDNPQHHPGVAHAGRVMSQLTSDYHTSLGLKYYFNSKDADKTYQYALMFDNWGDENYTHSMQDFIEFEDKFDCKRMTPNSSTTTQKDGLSGYVFRTKDDMLLAKLQANYDLRPIDIERFFQGLEYDH